MIHVVKCTNDKGLFVRIKPCSPLNDAVRLDFYRACASDIECDLLQAHLDAMISENMEQIRKVSYNAGWRDAKSHKKSKRDWFASATEVMDWERKP